MKRHLWIAVMLLIIAQVAVFAAGGAEKAAAKPVLALSAVTGGKNDEENRLFEAALEKATGLQITWERIASGYDQVLMAKLAASDPYDLVYINQFQMYGLADQGAIQDLSTRIAASGAYRDNVSAVELEKIAYGGKYYAGFNKLEVFPLPNVNKAITDKAGVDLSQLATLDDYYQMLRKVKTYMETTGGKTPYHPFFAYMADIWDLQPWFSSAGLRRGVFVGADGKKYAPYVDPKAEPVWAWLAKLYAEGLMSPDSFTGKTGDMRNKMWQSQDIVLDTDWAAWTGLYNNNARTAGGHPDKVNVVGLPGVKGPDGRYLLEQGNASLWAVPASSPNPDGGFRIIEYFATPEGGLLLSAGVEGHDYNLENGRVVYTAEGLTHGRDHGAPVPISKGFDMTVLGAANPGFLESLAVGRRSDVSVAPMGFANGALDARQYLDVLSKWMTECILNGKSADETRRAAADELRARKIID